MVNNYLSNQRHENVIDIQPEIVIIKKFQKIITNRYSQQLILEGIARAQYFSNRHNALQSIQNFCYRYKYFIPQVSFVYSKHKFGKREIKFTLKYLTQVEYPTIQHIAPLIDSSNLWFITKGNRFVLPEYNRRYSAILAFQSRKSKNPYSISLNVDYNKVEDKMTDSTLYDDVGRMQIYTVNTNGYSYWQMGTEIKKAFSPNTRNTFEFSSRYNIFRYVIPQYINNIISISKNIAHNIDMQIGYANKDFVNLKIQQGVYFYQNEQNSNNEDGLNSNVFYTRIGGTILLINRLLCGSNVTFSSTSAKSQPSIEYTIWNASLTYRFLSGNRGEIKFSALDMLKQNKSVINISERNSQTFGTSNVLQQYFLLSFSYFPRKFGK